MSIKDVAAAARVSPATVSNVLNRPELVARPTRERVHAAISSLGFVRNESARQLRAGHSRFIGLVVLDVANPFFTDLARGAEDLANESGLAIILCNSDEQSERERRYLDLLEEHRVRGILITPTGDSRDRIEDIRQRGIPVVLVDRSAGGACCSVSVDDVLGGRLAAEHLLALGHRRIGFVGGPFTLRQVRDRHQGAVQVVTEAGAELIVLETPALTVEQGRAAGDRLSEQGPGERPTAVFCANDLLSLGMLQAMTARGLAVPGDLAIIGYDDIGYAASAAIPLSSVRQPREQLGRAATRLLLAEIAGPQPHAHRQVMFEPELVIRESTAGREKGGL